MKTVIVPAPGKIEIRQVETPAINAYQALVKTEILWENINMKVAILWQKIMYQVFIP